MKNQRFPTVSTIVWTQDLTPFDPDIENKNKATLFYWLYYSKDDRIHNACAHGAKFGFVFTKINQNKI